MVPTSRVDAIAQDYYAKGVLVPSAQRIADDHGLKIMAAIGIQLEMIKRINPWLQRRIKR